MSGATIDIIDQIARDMDHRAWISHGSLRFTSTSKVATGIALIQDDLTDDVEQSTDGVIIAKTAVLRGFCGMMVDCSLTGATGAYRAISQAVEADTDGNVWKMETVLINQGSIISHGIRWGGAY